MKNEAKNHDCILQVNNSKFNFSYAAETQTTRKSKLVPRQDFLSSFQTRLLTLHPRSKIKLGIVRLTKEGRRKQLILSFHERRRMKF